MKSGILYGLASAALFGVSTPLAKALIGSIPPLWLAALLYLGAGFGFLVALLARRFADRDEPLALPSAGDWRWIGAAISLGGVVGPVALMYGLTATSGASASLLLNLEGVLTALLAWFVFRKTSTGGSPLEWQQSSRAQPRQSHSAGRRHKKLARPALKRQAVAYIVSHYGLKTRRACRLVRQTRGVHYYRSVKDPRNDLRTCMRELARTRVRYGYRRIYILLQRDGWRVGRSQLYRLYREEQLQLRSKLPKRRKMVVARRERIRPRAATKYGVWTSSLISSSMAPSFVR